MNRSNESLQNGRPLPKEHAARSQAPWVKHLQPGLSMQTVTNRTSFARAQKKGLSNRNDTTFWEKWKL